MINFGCEYLTKNNYLPIFCVDLLWKFIVRKNNEIEFSFCKSIEHGFIGIETFSSESELVENSNEDTLKVSESDNYYIILKMNYNDVMKMGLGLDNYGTNLTLRDIIHFLFTDEKMVERNLEKYRSSYSNQRKIYLKNNY